MRQVKSSNINGIKYDPENRTLDVHFANGGKYQYEGVGEDDYAALCAADDDPDTSFGSFFHKNVKGKFAAKKVKEK